MKENTKLLERIRIFAKHHHVPCISSDTAELLTQHLMKYKPVHCLEIGTAIGLSTLHIAGLIDSRGGQLTSFEISHPSYMLALHHQYLMQATNLTIYHSDFLEVPLERLLTTPIDFVFIDAAKAHYHLFLEKILPWCAPHATILCDDILAFHNKVTPLYDRLHTHQLTYQQLPAEEGDGLLFIQTK